MTHRLRSWINAWLDPSIFVALMQEQHEVRGTVACSKIMHNSFRRIYFFVARVAHR